MSIAYKIEFDNSKEVNFSEMITEVFAGLMECGREMVREYLEQTDARILEKRDKKRFRCKGTKKTSVKTKLGVIDYERRIYYDREEQKHVFLLDQQISAQSVGLVDKELCDSISEMICVMPYRKVSDIISETTGLDISHQAVWEIVQEQGSRENAKTAKLAGLLKENKLVGSIETKLLYEEADGDWLKLQGKDRRKYGTSKEMKIGIAYDGVLHYPMKGGKVRRELDHKVAYASFESSSEFIKQKEAKIAAEYNVDEIELRIKNGDGAQWIQKGDDCICVLDKYHRNKKITECVSDKHMAETLRGLLLSGQYEQLLEAIEAYQNSLEDETQIRKLKELYSYYSENFDALPDYYSRGIKIPETREPGVVHHARLGSMESNVFTLIGNRMKGRRACWSISGGNNLASLLCRYYTSRSSDECHGASLQQTEDATKHPLSAAKIPETVGNGYEYPVHFHPSPANKALFRLCNYSPSTI